MHRTLTWQKNRNCMHHSLSLRPDAPRHLSDSLSNFTNHEPPQYQLLVSINRKLWLYWNCNATLLSNLDVSRLVLGFSRQLGSRRQLPVSEWLYHQSVIATVGHSVHNDGRTQVWSTCLIQRPYSYIFHTHLDINSSARTTHCAQKFFLMPTIS